MRNTKAVLDKSDVNGATPKQAQKVAHSVEESHSISVGTFRLYRKGRWRESGVLEWHSERTGRLTLVARYRINGIPEAEQGLDVPPNFPDGPVLLLAGAGPAQTIRFRSSAVTFGHRFYFVCTECERNCGKLFLPPGRLQFACWLCH